MFRILFLFIWISPALCYSQNKDTSHIIFNVNFHGTIGGELGINFLNGKNVFALQFQQTIKIEDREKFGESQSFISNGPRPMSYYRAFDLAYGRIVRYRNIFLTGTGAISVFSFEMPVNYEYHYIRGSGFFGDEEYWTWGMSTKTGIGLRAEGEFGYDFAKWLAVSLKFAYNVNNVRPHYDLMGGFIIGRVK